MESIETIMDLPVLDLCSRAETLFAQFEQQGRTAYLDQAIVLGREALRLFPSQHYGRSTFCSIFTTHLFSRFYQLGVMKDLDEAVVLAREALELCPARNADRFTFLNNLSIYLSNRHNQLGVIKDLDEAIVLAREALEFHPLGHPSRSESLSGLAADFITRYNKLGDAKDLDAAILLDQEVLELCPPGHPDRSQSLSNLAADLTTQYNQLSVIKYLDEAIDLSREALKLYPPGHLGRPCSLNNLAVLLSTRYEHVRSMKDLDDSIVLDRESLNLFPPGHPGRLPSLKNLAQSLHTRFIQSSQLQDQEELFDLYSEVMHMPLIVSSNAVSATRAWVLVAEYLQHPTILSAYETSLRTHIQRLATLPSLPQDLTVLKDLTSSLAADAFSACLRNHSPTTAVELLELGRNAFWSQLSRLRSPLDDVTVFRLAGTKLVSEFTQLTSLIHTVLSSADTAQHGRASQLNTQLQRVINDIRDLPGLSRFLLPPLFLDLQLAAREGPVIIVNASQYSCDALVVFLDEDPVHIQLQITHARVRELSSAFHTLISRAKVVNVNRDLVVILRELWHQVVSSIVEVLRTTQPLQSRIWWCPTSAFSLLPLHAAGPYRQGQQNFADLYVSSYTPTLTALIRARRHYPSISATERKHFVAIGQAFATGESELVSVGTELTSIAQCVEGVANFARVEGHDSCVSRVSEELGKNQWVHLACHGLSDSKEPVESAFALRDGQLTVKGITRCDMKDPQFAFLSACHTTVADEESPAEVIHLASAMQFSGFRSVIGTMWAADDGYVNEITSMFYKNMVDESGRLEHDHAAFALQKTVESARIPFDQRILYIHLGA